MELRLCQSCVEFGIKLCLGGFEVVLSYCLD